MYKRLEPEKTYSVYPAWIVFLSNLVSFLIYGSGFFILFRLGWIAAILYLFCIMAFELRLLSRHCVNCWYWGRMCGFGKGRLSSLLFKRGDPGKFCNNEMTWKDLIPDLFISLVPLLIGIVLMIIDFDFILLIAVIILIILSTAGNGFIRGSLTCKYCKQREIGCPADELFNKRKKPEADLK
jgi:hypothetical protein